MKYEEPIHLRVKRSTKAKIVKIALDTDQSKGAVIRSLIDVGLKVKAIEKQRTDQE